MLSRKVHEVYIIVGNQNRREFTMRIISLLIALLIIGFLVKKQLDSNSSTTEYEDIISNENITVPKVPTAPNDVQKFEKDMNEFILNAADQRAKEVENALNNY